MILRRQGLRFGAGANGRSLRPIPLLRVRKDEEVAEADEDYDAAVINTEVWSVIQRCVHSEPITKHTAPPAVRGP